MATTSTASTHITLNLHGRKIKAWKLFIIEKLMCSDKWPAEVHLRRPTPLPTFPDVPPISALELFGNPWGVEILGVQRKLVSTERETSFSKDDLISLKLGIAWPGHVGAKLESLRNIVFVGQMDEEEEETEDTNIVTERDSEKEYGRGRGCLLTFVHQPSPNPLSRPIEVSLRKREGVKRKWEERGWYEQLKMLWKGNMIEPRWDAETQKRGEGEREFTIKKSHNKPPEEVREIRELEIWEKKILVDETPSIVEEAKATGAVLYDEALKKGGKLVDEAKTQVFEKVTGWGNMLEEVYRGWGQ